MTFLHISDLHYLRDYSSDSSVFRPIFQAMTPPLAQLDLLLRQMAAQPDFLLITGDLVHEGTKEDYESLKKGLADRFPGLPVYSVPGNHDNKRAWQAVFGRGQARVSAVPLDGFQLILLDNTWPGLPGGQITEQDMHSLRKLLNSGGEPAILAMHHHLIKNQFVLPPAAYPESLPVLLSEGRVHAILNGHTHHLYQGQFFGVKVHNAGSLSFRGIGMAAEVEMEEYPIVQLCRFSAGELHINPVISPFPPRILGRVRFTEE